MKWQDKQNELDNIRRKKEILILVKATGLLLLILLIATFAILGIVSVVEGKI